MTSATPWPPTNEHGRPNIVLTILALAGLMSVLDLFIVSVALPPIEAHLQASTAQVVWVLDAYALVLGAFAVPAGRFGEKIGLKTVFMLGTSLFTVASLGCTLSPDVWVLVGFRCVQALGAAMLLPSSRGLVVSTMPPARVRSAVRLWTMCVATGGAIGPVIGGLLTPLGWHGIFLINVPIGLAVLVIALKTVPFHLHDISTKLPGVGNSVMLIVGTGAISFSLLNGHRWGWGDGRIIAGWGVAAVAAAGLVLRPDRGARSIVDPQASQDDRFKVADLSMLVGASILGMQLFGMGLLLAKAWHWSTVDTWLGITPGPVAIVVSAWLCRRLGNGLRAPLAMTMGFGIIASSQVLMLVLLLGGGRNYVGELLPAWMVTGIGFGVLLTAIASSAAAGPPATLRATAGSRQLIGGAVGLAVLIMVLGTTAAAGDVGQNDQLWLSATAGCAAVVCGSLGLTRRHTRERET